MTKYIEKERPTPNKKKNTRRWCKGKVGVEHDPVWQEWDECKSIIKKENLIFKCIKCGKHFDSWFEWFDNRFRIRYKKPEIGSREPKQKLED